MVLNEIVRVKLVQIERVLRQFQCWQSMASVPDVFDSELPFCMDVLQPYEWLQWVFIPRFQALLDGGLPLPETCVITPYFEVALAADFPGRAPLLEVLQALDDAFSASLA